MEYNELIAAFKTQIDKFSHNAKIVDWGRRLEAENKGFGWPAIYANFVMKQIAKMTDENLAAFFSRPEFN